jgi:membrane-bound lytic murein transglycosylase B
VALLLAGSAAAQPAPDAPIPQTPPAAAAALVDTAGSLWKAIDAWRESGLVTVPDEVTLYALYEQRLLRLMSKNEGLWNQVLPRLPPKLAHDTQDVVVAHRELVRITPPLRAPTIRVGQAAPAADLLRWYHDAERRFGVPWRFLAAVNFVESAFGKLRSASAAGAQGPMQFLPSTWRTYGLGGDVHDPHDAILGGANYLRAAGARRNIRRALYAYNPSPLYVDAVLRYARRIRADIHAFYAFYSWQVFVRTTSGVHRVTGPGRH